MLNIRTPYNLRTKERVLHKYEREIKNNCVQSDTSIAVLLKDQSALENTVSNPGSYSGDDVVDLFQPPLVNRPLDPVEIHFQQEQAKQAQTAAAAAAEQQAAANAATVQTENS